MSRYYNIHLIPSSTSPGPYTIYWNTVSSGSTATIFSTGLPATGLTLTQLTGINGVNVIVDDLICSGNTIRYIKNTIYEECPRAKCFGVYSYIPSECVYGSNMESSYRSCKAQLGITYLNSLYGISKDGY